MSKICLTYVYFSCVSPTCESKAACKLSKEKRRNRGREYEIRIGLEIWNRIAGGKLLCVLKTLVLEPKHFCFRILVPMSILTFDCFPDFFCCFPVLFFLFSFSLFFVFVFYLVHLPANPRPHANFQKNSSK